MIILSVLAADGGCVPRIFVSSSRTLELARPWLKVRWSCGSGSWRSFVLRPLSRAFTHPLLCLRHRRSRRLRLCLCRCWTLRHSDIPAAWETWTSAPPPPPPPPPIHRLPSVTMDMSVESDSKQWYNLKIHYFWVTVSVIFLASGRSFKLEGLQDTKSNIILFILAKQNKCMVTF